VASLAPLQPSGAFLVRYRNKCSPAEASRSIGTNRLRNQLLANVFLELKIRKIVFIQVPWPAD
jgi:hypothetical protein